MHKRLINTTISVASPKIRVNIGIEIDVIMDARETYPVSAIIIIHTEKPSQKIFGINAITTPALAATPFPPLNLKNIVQLWPAIAAMPTAALYNSGLAAGEIYKNRLAI